MIDPSSPIAQQETQKTLDAIAAKQCGSAATTCSCGAPSEEPK